jgi:hypothetical protein
MSCLDNIISIPECNSEASLSGLDITNLPGITIKQAASIAQEKYMSGINLIRQARTRALQQIQSDLISYLQGNRYAPSLITKSWSTLATKYATVKVATDLGDYRGIVIKAQQRNCGLKKLHIQNVYIKAAHTGTLILRIEDGELSYPYPFESVDGSISKVVVNFTSETDEIHLLLPDSIDVYSVLPNCQCGGNNLPKSDCATVRGYYNGTETKAEGFGIWADVQCKCDYSLLMCMLATQGIMGEIVLYKTGVNIMDERLKTDRLNYFTTYGDEEAAQTKAEWNAEYGEKWNTLIAALPGLLPTVDKCGCIECGTSRKANI